MQSPPSAPVSRSRSPPPRAGARHPPRPSTPQPYVFSSDVGRDIAQRHTYPTALSPPHNRFHVLHQILQAVGSNKCCWRHNDPSVGTHPGVPFILAQHAWRFERRAINWSCPSDQISRSACLCREPWTAYLSEQCITYGCNISTHPSTLVDTEHVEFS